MKSKIFTFFAFMLVSLIGNGQPLPGSPLPDTITYNYRSKASERLLMEYNNDLTKSKTTKQTWDSLAHDFMFSLDTIFTYNIDKKIETFMSSDGFVGEYYYYANKKDSLQNIYHNDKLIYTTLFNDKGNFTSYKSWIIVEDTLQPQYEESYYYNQFEKIRKLETSFFIDGVKTYEGELNYEYDSQGRLELSNRKQRILIIADTSWRWVYKSEFKYLDEDDLVDETFGYQYNANGWYLTGRSEYFYSPLENISLLYDLS